MTCEALHMMRTGASEGDPTLRQGFANWLRYRLKVWTPGTPSSLMYDEAVRLLVHITLYTEELSDHENRSSTSV